LERIISEHGVWPSQRNWIGARWIPSTTAPSQFWNVKFVNVTPSPAAVVWPDQNWSTSKPYAVPLAIKSVKSTFARYPDPLFDLIMKIWFPPFV